MCFIFCYINMNVIVYKIQVLCYAENSQAVELNISFYLDVVFTYKQISVLFCVVEFSQIIAYTNVY